MERPFIVLEISKVWVSQLFSAVIFIRYPQDNFISLIRVLPFFPPDEQALLVASMMVKEVVKT
jgi:hypothetical protein